MAEEEYRILPDEMLRDLRDMKGRRNWKEDRPLPAATYFVQRSRVENFRVVSRMIRDVSDAMEEPRTVDAVWCSVCHAVDVFLGDPGMTFEKSRTLLALELAGRPNLERDLVAFSVHRAEGGSKTWREWLGLDVRQGC